jgi:hypothetical protein
MCNEDASNSDLHLIASVVSSLKYSREAFVTYDIFSDALIWSDEMPDPGVETLPYYSYFRPVLRYRSSLILGVPEDRCRTQWEEAIRCFPKWPGFNPDRRSRALADVLVRLSSDADADIERLFPEDEEDANSPR